jgi:hypothetical protein
LHADVLRKQPVAFAGWTAFDAARLLEPSEQGMDASS